MRPPPIDVEILISVLSPIPAAVQALQVRARYAVVLDCNAPPNISGLRSNDFRKVLSSNPNTRAG